MSFGQSRLLLTTALLVPLSGTAFAQTSETACDDLAVLLDSGLPEDMQSERDQYQSIVEVGDAEACMIEITTIQEASSARQSDTASDEQSATAEAEVADTAQTTLTLQDEVTVRGTVFLDRSPPSIDITEGETDVEIEPGSPDITVAAVAPEIVVRQAPAEITVDMPSPTIRISQAAPEIIITMPDPNVSVGAGEPKVEVRQADPVVSISQVPPTVELELSRVEPGEENPGFSVNDRRSGTSYAAGESVDAITEQEAEVQITKSQPRVTMIEPEQSANVEYQRADPTVRFEQAEPNVTFGEQSEPTIQFEQSGEPTITIETAQADTGPAAEDSEQAAAEAPAETTPEPQPEQPAALAETQPTDTQATDTQATDTTSTMAEPEVDTAAAPEPQPEGVITTETPVELRGPGVERDGYSMMAAGEFDFQELEGVSVYGINDENIGEIGAMVVSADGTVSEMIVEVGGFLGLGQKDVALPYDRFTILRGEGGDYRTYIESTEEELEQMPDYEG